MLGIFGTISNPLTTMGAANYGGNEGQGLIVLFTSLIRLMIIIAGLYTFLNIILAGYGYLSASGDPKMIQKAQEKIWRSMLGLIIILASFIIAGVLGYVLYGASNWDIIFHPVIFRP